MADQIKNAELLLAASSIQKGGGRSADADLFELCALGLRELADRMDEYHDFVAAAQPFAEHLKEGVRSVCGLSCTGVDKQGIAFALMEDMAVMIREVTLRKGYKNLSQAEQKIMHYFESSGHWTFNGGSLVTDYYYMRIPIAVMHGFVERTQELIRHKSLEAV